MDISPRTDSILYTHLLTTFSPATTTTTRTGDHRRHRTPSTRGSQPAMQHDNSQAQRTGGSGRVGNLARRQDLPKATDGPIQHSPSTPMSGTSTPISGKPFPSIPANQLHPAPATPPRSVNDTSTASLASGFERLNVGEAAMRRRTPQRKPEQNTTRPKGAGLGLMTPDKAVLDEPTPQRQPVCILASLPLFFFLADPIESVLCV
jgi:hypothetical protein